MSHYSYDFLADSVLFSDTFLSDEDQHIDSAFRILEDYVKHCKDHIETTIKEIRSTSHAGIRTFQSPYKRLPSCLRTPDLMTQLILQDMVIVPDPLFSFCFRLRNRNANAAYSAYMGLAQHNDLEELREICRYMKEVTPLVAHGVLKFFPDFASLDKPGIPIVYSPTGFAEVFEENVLQWVHKRAIVSPMTRIDGGFRLHKDRRLSPCRLIHVDFEASDGDCGSVYTLLQNKITGLDGKSDEFTMTMELPSTPPEDDYFRHWIFQSINQAALKYLVRTRKEVFYTDLLRATYCPQNDFILGMISEAFSVDERKVVNERPLDPVRFGLQIPAVMDVGKFLRLRNDTDALLSFRSYLSDKLKSLSSLKDPDEIRRASKDIRDELTQEHLPKLRHALSLFRKAEGLRWLGISAGIGVASISGSGVVAGLAAIGLAARGIKSTMDGLQRVKSMPGYFWHRVSKTD